MKHAFSRRWQAQRLGLIMVLLILSALAFPLYKTSWVRAQTQPEANQSFPAVPRIHVPYFANEIRFAETAIFWFGQVNQDDNYTDVRVGYNDEIFYLYLAIFDRQMWYDTTPNDVNTLNDWDAVTLYLNTGPGAPRYRIVAQVNHDPDASPGAVWQADGNNWVPVNLPLTRTTGWRGDRPNDNAQDERGWVMTFEIPFASLGLSGPPTANTAPWLIGLTVHDRDAATGPLHATTQWPNSFAAQDTNTWGEIAFGRPSYIAPTVTQPQNISIYHKANGANVPDAAVGGGAICGDGLEFWTQWGVTNYAGRSDFNIQNQSDVADWPCFSKYYVTFPLDVLPPAQGIVSATLTLHLFGTAGGGAWGGPTASLIQAGIANQDWAENSLVWNNAPSLLENVSASWVQPLSEFPGWPGVAYQWDVSRAVADAYARGIPLRLVLYSADSDYHSGKYFVSSDTGDWNAAGRPTLKIVYGAVDNTAPTATATATTEPTTTATATSTATATTTAEPTANPTGTATPTAIATVTSTVTPTVTSTVTATPTTTTTPAATPAAENNIYLPNLER